MAAASQASSGEREGRGQPLRARALVALALLLPGLVFFMVWGDWLVGGGGALESLSGPGLALLCLLTAANTWLKRHRSRWALSPGELIALYAVFAMAAGMTGNVWCWGGTLAAIIASPAWLASPANQWADIMWPNLPPGVWVTDREALAGFFLGSSTPYRLAVLRAWLEPALWWTGWAGALLAVTLFFSVVIRRRWSDEEKLPFPLTIVPTHLADPESRLFRSRPWWVGLAIGAGIEGLGALGLVFPAMPTIPTYISIGSFLANNRPWDAIRTTSLSWGPWEVGISYLMPVDLAFSLIVFNLFWRGEYVFTRMQGWMTSAWGGPPYGDQQVIGSYISLMAITLWLDRRYLLQVARRAAGLPSLADDRREAFSYRTAAWGGLAALGFMWWFLARGGMRPAIALAFLGLLFIMIMAMIRMRAQLGPPAHWMYGTMPEFVLLQFPGGRAIGPRALGTIAIFRAFMYEQDSHPAPVQIEALRMAERGTLNPRHLGWLLLAVGPATMLLYFWASLHFGYRYGLGAKVYPDMIEVCNQFLNKADGWLRNPGGPNWSGVQAIGAGCVVTVLLMHLKLRFPMWPLHPVAFPLAFSWSIDSMVPAIILAWVVKVLLLRYGGLRAHRRALPFFIGLLAGSAVLSMVQTTVYRLLYGV